MKIYTHFKSSRLFLATCTACCFIPAYANINSPEQLSHQSYDQPYVFNTYKAPKNDTHPLEISAYAADWSQYQRNIQLGNFASRYDRIIIAFFGLCGSKVGDPTNTQAVRSVADSCNNAGQSDFEVTTSDPWGDGHFNNAASFFDGQSAVKGGVLKQLSDAQKENPGLKAALSIGGWSLSEPFSRMAEDAQNRQIFEDSIVKIIKLYPMFDQVDIDWEYPGVAINQNSYDESDGQNYATLIAELRKKLDGSGLKKVHIAISASADVEKLKKSNLKNMIAAGVDTVHLMTYDFFGSGWSEHLSDQTNLHPDDFYDIQNYSIDAALDYINQLGVDNSRIFIGYASYSRNAGGVKQIDSISPLAGEYDKSSAAIGGTWESGVNEWYDLQKNFLDISPASGLKAKSNSSFELMTDEVADADFLYSPKYQMFMSFDTPRTVYAKALYAKTHHLGGLFSWLADYDTGYLLNAAREGAGYQVVSQKVDMSKIIYSCGVNITDHGECETLTNKEADGDNQ